MDAGADRSSMPTSATTTWRRPATTPSGASPTTRRARAPGAGQAAQGAGRRAAARFGRALEIGAGTGYFIINLVRAGVVAEAVATDISRRHARRSCRPRRRARRERGDRRLRGVGASVRGRRPSTSWSATPCSTTFPIWTPPSASSGACSARRRGGVLRRALALRRPARGAAQARGTRTWRPLWRALMGAGRCATATRTPTGGGSAGAGGGRARIHAGRARQRTPAVPGSTESA